MELCRWSEQVILRSVKSAGYGDAQLDPMRDYILSENNFQRVIADETIRQRLYKVSKLETRMPPFHVGARHPGSQRLLLYNGSGGYGDQIMTWPIAHWLHNQGYEVHVLTDPGNQCCWFNLPFVRAVYTLPYAYESFKLFDYHVLLEHVTNRDEHQDQLHPVDTMLLRMGVDPKSVPPEQKVVSPNFSWLEMQSANAFPTPGPLGFYQLAASNAVRSLPAGDSAFMAQRLAEAFPETRWVCVYDQFVPKEYMEAVTCKQCLGTGEVEIKLEVSSGTQTVPGKQSCPNCRGSRGLTPNIQPIAFKSLRELWALVFRRADVCVGPDSMLSHAAGAMGVPMVGLWGPMAPASRIGYYKQHRAIWHREACPHSPCFAYSTDFPKYCPPRGPKRNVCEVMAAVMPDEVVEAVRAIRRKIIG